MRPEGSRRRLGEVIGLEWENIKDDKIVLGHRQIEATLKYVQTDFERVKKAVELLGEKALTKNKNTANISRLKAEVEDG